MADHVSATKFPTAADDGGLVFPSSRMEPNPIKEHVLEQTVHVDYPGMSLRDYFAAKAISTSYAACEAYNATVTKADAKKAEDVARAAYALADAMLTERAKESRR